jgi:hypothetical protein
MSSNGSNGAHPDSDADQKHEALMEGMARGVANAIETHRRLKQPIVGMRDGRIVWLRPEDIAPRPLPGDDEPLPEELEI